MSPLHRSSWLRRVLARRPAQRAVRSVALAFAVVAAASAGVAAPGAPKPVSAPPAMPGAATKATAGDPVARNATCEGCHAEIAAEWRASGHRTAFTDRDFRASLAREPVPFCRGCHAPEADPKADPPSDRGELGVGCVSCHTPHGAKEVLAGPLSSGPAVPRDAVANIFAGVRERTGPGPSRTPANSLAEAPGTTSALAATAHTAAVGPLVRSSEFAGDGGCGGCHEFAFPDSDRRTTPLLMQSTIHEAKTIGFGAACNDCHMPNRASALAPSDGSTSRPHRDHRFTVDTAMLEGALDAAATRDGNRVTLTLQARGVGHAFPTGDLFRRLVVTLKTGGRTRKIPLARAWEDHSAAEGTLRRLAFDSRLQNTPVSFVEQSPEPVQWEVRYERAASRTDARGLVPVATFGGTVLAAGVR